MTKYRHLLQQHWQRLSHQQKQYFAAGAAVAALLLLILLLVMPALKILRHSPAQHAKLYQQVILTNSWRQEATQLKNKPYLAKQEKSDNFLKISQQQLGSKAKVATEQDNITTTLNSVATTELFAWLENIQTNAKLLPDSVNIQYDYSTATWSGAIVFKLPAT